MARNNSYGKGFAVDPISDRRIGQNLNYVLADSGLLVPVSSANPAPSQIGDGTNLLEIDSISDALPTIETDHKRIHDGQGYKCTAKFTAIASDADLNILLVNPVANFSHLRLYRFTATGGPLDTFLFSGTTVSANGTSIISHNLNENSDNTADLDIYHTPTITTDGTEIEYDLLPTDGNKAGTQTTAVPLEHIFKPDTNYLLRMTNNDAQAVDVGLLLFWYES